jgi:predicted lipoprotein with Yx(FWY)xxD motif
METCAAQSHTTKEHTMPTNQPSGLARSLPSPKLIVGAAAALALLAAAILLLNPPKLHASASSGTVVSAAKTSLGRIVVNSRGRTLYLFGKDRNGKSACSGQCATFWPPLIASGKPRVAGVAKASLLGVIKRADGRRQVTYNHHPLYTFVKDKSKGQTHGEGVSAFGSKWYAVSPSGAKVLPKRAGNGIPQNNGGDHDSDNNGGPSDGDGNI